MPRRLHVDSCGVAKDADPLRGAAVNTDSEEVWRLPQFSSGAKVAASPLDGPIHEVRPPSSYVISEPIAWTYAGAAVAGTARESERAPVGRAFLALGEEGFQHALEALAGRSAADWSRHGHSPAVPKQPLDGGMV